MPRVAFLTNCLPPYHKPVLDALTKRWGHGNFRILLSTAMESNRAWELEWDGLNVVVQKTVTAKGCWRHTRGFSENTEVHFPIDTIAQLRAFSPDVVISNEMGFRSIGAVAYTKLRRRASAILWTEVNASTECGRGIARGVVRRILARHVDAFLALGESGVRYIESLGCAPEKIFRFAYTADVNRFASASVPEVKHPRLLYVGQLIERKGLLQFVSALGKWAHQHPNRKVELLLAGDGPLRARLESSRVPPNLHLEFLGNVRYEQLPQVYARAGVLAFPTLADTWGVVVNEAMASGLPVLGSAYSQAVAQMVTDGESGWIFRPDRPNEMDSAIHRCLTARVETLDAMRREAHSAAMKLSPSYVANLIEKAVAYCMHRKTAHELSDPTPVEAGTGA